jgi:hypothetical protein
VLVKGNENDDEEAGNKKSGVYVPPKFVPHYNGI